MDFGLNLISTYKSERKWLEKKKNPCKPNEDLLHLQHTSISTRPDHILHTASFTWLNLGNHFSFTTTKIQTSP